MTSNQPLPAPSGFLAEFRHVWDQLPWKGPFLVLLAAWCTLFHFFGNSTLGYVDSASLFQWLSWMYSRSEDDAHGQLIPFVVLGLFWWKRQDLMAVAKRPWWPALTGVLVGLFFHVVGYSLQQTQISVVAFFLGLYALTGVVWGPRWLKASFFPFCLFAFCLPVANVSGFITFPLRLIASQITGLLCNSVLGINCIQDGTRIFDPSGGYEYEVAAACSGMRSLTATLALATIYAFVMLKSPWRRLLMMAMALPLSVGANVFRLTTIIVAAEAFGRDAGNFVHNSSLFSLLPYLPAMLGIVGLGYLLREDKKARAPDETPLIFGAEQKS